jgi:hypothetical protein
MTADTEAPEGQTLQRAIAPTPVRGDVIDTYESMIEQVPDAGNSGFEGILEAIALAGSAADLDAPWNANGLGKYAGVPLVVTGIRKMQSDFEGPLPWFLIVDGAVLSTGEKIAATTGALGVVAQLVRAHALGAFPWACIPRYSKRATAEGYYPMHLEGAKSPTAAAAAGQGGSAHK